MSWHTDTGTTAECAQKHTRTRTPQSSRLLFFFCTEMYPPLGIPASQKANPRVISFLIHGFSWFLERSDIFRPMRSLRSVIVKYILLRVGGKAIWLLLHICAMLLYKLTCSRVSPVRRERRIVPVYYCDHWGPQGPGARRGHRADSQGRASNPGLQPPALELLCSPFAFHEPDRN